MRTLFFIILVALLQPSTLLAKKFGDVPMSLLQAKAHELDSSAHASYFQKNVDVSYNYIRSAGFRLESEYHHIIKIYDEKGESYANFEIPYYESKNGKEKVRSIKAVSVNLVDGKVVKTKLDKKDIFKEETTENWRLMKFAVPNVKAGSVIEVKYTISTPFIRTIPRWYFQNYVPTDESIYKIKVPQYFTLTPVPTGTVALDMQEKRVSISDMGEVQYIITGKGIPAIEEDKYVLNENDYRSSIKYEIQSTQFPDGSVEYYSKDWKEIAIDLMSSKSFGKQITKKFKDLNPVIDEAKALDKPERIKFIYDYVRSNYAWDGDIGLRSIDGLKETIQNKTGSVADINLLLINLLRKSEIDCNAFAISSRNSGLLNTNFPSISSLNYLLVYVPTNDRYILLDASSKMSPMGELPVRATNINGVLIKKDGAEIMDLAYDNNFFIQTVSQYTFDLENNKLLGTSQRRRSDYAATNYRLKLEEDTDEESQEAEDDDNENEDSNDEGQADDIESYDLENNYEVTEAKNIDNIYKPINLKYNEELVTVMKKAGGKIFLDAALDFGIKKNPFEDELRDHPIFYNYKIRSETLASIDIPEGYVVESTPENVKVTLPNDMGGFQYLTKITGNKLSINYKFNIKETIIFPEVYPSLKKIYEMLIDKHNEKIIFAKADGY